MLVVDGLAILLLLAGGIVSCGSSFSCDLSANTVAFRHLQLS